MGVVSSVGENASFDALTSHSCSQVESIQTNSKRTLHQLNRLQDIIRGPQ